MYYDVDCSFKNIFLIVGSLSLCVGEIFKYIWAYIILSGKCSNELYKSSMINGILIWTNII